MEIEISIKGRVVIPEDDLKRTCAQGKEELASILLREGYDIKTDVREVYTKGGK